MTRSHLAGQRLRLQDLKDTTEAVRTLRDVPDVVERSMARYLTVRAAGYIEAVRDDAADLYAEAAPTPLTVTRRVRAHLRTGLGVRPEQLLAFVGSFDPAWRDELDSLLNLDDAALRSNLGSLVAARKKIAHGDGESVTSGKALRWAATAERIGSWLIARFDPRLDPSTPVDTRSTQ